MYADGPRITSGVGASASGGGKYGSLGEDGDDGGESDVCADDDGVWDSEEEELEDEEESGLKDGNDAKSMAKTGKAGKKEKTENRLQVRSTLERFCKETKQ